ncbi:MAG TPA: DUF1848 domain-containing protein [Ignavibacteriaceae bacterium]|nr:DUF1848 domain-containing protein [Ignavibacteriaceae bacterium]
MIITASRRTDIPAYFSEWFMNRINEKYCTVQNPYYPEQVSFIDLTPEAVESFVFVTKNAAPMIKHIQQLNDEGYKYYFHYTVNNLPNNYERNIPSFENGTNTFIKLVDKIGKGKVIWRYDPIIFTNDLTLQFHKQNFEKIYNKIGDYTKRLVISVVDNYAKTIKRLNKLNVNYNQEQLKNPELDELIYFIKEKASLKNIEIVSCAEPILKDYSIKEGKCIDDDLMREELGVITNYKKSKSQRDTCSCVESRDIGFNNTCLMGCEYCYATLTHETAVKNKSRHNPLHSSIVEHKIPEKIVQKINEHKNKSVQLSLNI